MGIFDGFAEGLAAAVDDIRHTYEQSVWGQQTTGNIELPQVEAPTIEAPSNGASNTIDLTSSTVEQGWGVSPATFIESPSYSAEADYAGRVVEPPIEPTTWAQAAQGIEAPQIEPPAPSQDLER